MERLTPEALHAYAAAMSTPQSAVLAALERETHLKVLMPQMISGAAQGRLLSMMSHMLRPKAVLEIGTFTGYSAICMAEGLADGGVLHTIDINEELADLCARYWQRAGVQDKISQHTGRAADIIPALTGPYDLVFIDADKQGYSQYFDLVINKVRPGGIILADNVLQDGDVLSPAEAQSRNAKAISAFNEKVAADARVVVLMLPLRDGLTVMRKV